MENNKNVQIEILNLIKENKDITELQKSIQKYHPFDVALALKELETDDFERIQKVFSPQELAEIFSYIDEDESTEILEDMSPNVIANIVNEMEIDDAVDVLNELDDDIKSDVLELVSGDVKEDYESLKEYEDDSAGSLMTTTFVSVKTKSDVKVAMKNVVSLAPIVESFNTIFVVDDNDKLLGTIELKKLISTKSPCIVDDIMLENFQTVNVDINIEDVIKIIKDYDIYELPVLKGEKLVGMITMDDALDALYDQKEEDYAKLSGLNSEEENESPLKSVKNRLPWLAGLVVLNVLVSLTLTLFENIIENVTVLILFQPLLLGIAGNTSTQSLATTVRKIGENFFDNKKEERMHLLKEMSIGLLLGLFIGLIAFLYSYIFLNVINYNELPIIKISFILCLSVFISLIVANLLGALIPIFLTKIKVDPAIASGPFITTLNDIITIVIYFTLASLILSHFI